MTRAAETTELFAAPQVHLEERPDGTLLLCSGHPLGPYPRSMGHVFSAGAAAHPDRVLAAERRGEDWRSVTWGETEQAAREIAAALLAHGLGPERPLMILSGNAIDHLQLTLGGFLAGVPVMPVSPAYSLASRDHARIRALAELCTPGIVYASDGEGFAAALGALRDRVPEHVVGRSADGGATTLDRLREDGRAGAAGIEPDRIGPDAVAKLLFTSGSTGQPKGVITTHRMLCSNQQAMGQVWPFLHAEPPVLVDWLPWSHTFGGSHNVGQVLAYGGTIHIDDGRPAPALFERTVEALRAHPPTIYYNVPAGYALLTPRLEEDREFAERFFSRLRLMFYAAAALPEALWERLRRVAAAVADHAVPLTASWGTTETAPGATTAHYEDARCGCIGVPLPGVTMKLVPQGGKLEMRLTGPNVTPGYFRDPEATAAAFDEEGFYRPGDAARPVDPGDPSRGLMFDGRLAEDFKLSSGTFVHVGKLRVALLSAAGVVADAAICGHDRDYVGALAWVNQAEARRRLGRDDDVALDDPQLVSHLAAALAELNGDAGATLRVERLLLLAEPPDIDAGEITDKGYLNQRTVLERRAERVRELFAEPPGPGVITPRSS